jgi:GrpB-like predicted nucleotidyltransferase (UPF0157 family)
LPITIEPYRPTWSDEFQAIGETLRQALGDLAVRIDHIGSTAILGLAAKDLIDVQITVRSFAPGLDEALGRAGYQRIERITQDHLPPGVSDIAEWTKRFYKPPAPGRSVNVHARLDGRANQRYALLFRDYLRARPAMAEAYARVKRGLVAHCMDSEDAYYDVKDPVCDLIMGGAEAWAESTGWRPGPSDR